MTRCETSPCSTQARRVGRLLVAGFLPALACGAGGLGATDADLARAREATSRGAEVFAKKCVSCHGRHGEGFSDSPPILGRGALPEYARERPPTGVPGVQDPELQQVEQQTRRTGTGERYPFRTALDLYNFISTHPRESRRGPARTDDDWAVVTFLAAAQGAALPAEGVTPENADAIAVPRK